MKLLVTDYDNTLELHYDFTDNKNILKRNIFALNKFMKNNIVCIATGRHFNAIHETILENNIKFNYLCANNGAELYNKNYNLLFCLPIEKYDLQVLKKIGEKVIFRNAYNSKLIPSANLYINDLNEYNEIRKYLKSNLKHSFVEYKYPKIKVINKKCNKLNVIDIIRTLEEIKEENIYAIGDDINDIEMILKYNGYSLTTAKEEVKKIASKIYDELNQLISDIN
ncbi:MAG: HAD family phosphatase [Firmicutes bacterium]|nr:HAD family phosphatase [Bacillota bacterium]